MRVLGHDKELGLERGKELGQGVGLEHGMELELDEVLGRDMVLV